MHIGNLSQFIRYSIVTNMEYRLYYSGIVN